MGCCFSHSDQTVSVPKPFHVAPHLPAVLDFSVQSGTPESKVKYELLSRAIERNSVALVGMGGSGKTTILKQICHDQDIWDRYRNGIWFISLGHHSDLSKLIDQLEKFAREACPQFVKEFQRLSASQNAPTVLIEKLFNQLKYRNILLIIDDVWGVSDTLHALLEAFCVAVRKLPSASLKLLTSTRAHDLARVPLYDVHINVIPDASDTETAKRILCHYADVERSNLQSLLGENKEAMENIVRTCAGLPLTLSLAGASVLREMDQLGESHKDDAWVRYWDSLRLNVRRLGGTESDELSGLYASLQTSLDGTGKSWKVEKISVVKIFQSLSVIQKKSFVPFTVLQNLWHLDQNDAKQGIDLLIESNIASTGAAVDESDSAVVSIHDLVHDYAVHLARDQVTDYHANLVDKYYTTAESSTSITRWQKLAGDTYMTQNIVRHMLGAGRGAEALELLTDYGWIQNVNNDETRLPFRKIMTDLAMLRDYVEENECGENASLVSEDIRILIDTMGRCLMPICLKNRRECSFQLYGRLASLRSDSSVVRRVIWGIEKHSARPWIRAGAGVLRGVDNELKRLIVTPVNIMCLKKGLQKDELVVGGYKGEVRVIGSTDGEVRRVLDGREKTVRALCIDDESGEIYTCLANGLVHVRKKSVHRVWRARLHLGEQLHSAVLLPKRGALIYGSSDGTVRSADKNSGLRPHRFADGHSGAVSCLAVGRSEKVLVSGSADRSLRVWNVHSGTPIGDALAGHTDLVTCVALSGDERTIASASADRSVRVWSVQERRLICRPLVGHKFSVSSVVFSADARVLYSAAVREVIVWDVGNVATGVCMVRRCFDARVGVCFPLVLSRDESRLFAGNFNDGNLLVWDAQRLRVSDTVSERFSFVSDVRAFGISCDGAFIGVFNRSSKEMEIRAVRDVVDGIDRVINTFQLDFYVCRVAISNGAHLVAFCAFPDLAVFVIDVSSGRTLCTFSDAEDWAKSLQDRDQMYLQPYVYSLHFNAEGTVLSAEVFAQQELTGEKLTRSFRWNIDSSPTQAPPALENIPTLPSGHRDRPLHMFGDLADSVDMFSEAIQMNYEDSTVTIATLDHPPFEVGYSPLTQTFWASKDDGGLQHVQLVTAETELEQWREPQLPALSNTPHAGIQPHHATSAASQANKGRVSVSLAGPDRDTMAREVHEKLSQLGYQVFFEQPQSA